MILTLRLKNFYSILDEAVLDFTADLSTRRRGNILPGNLIDFDADRFVNIIGLFGGNAAGKSNIIKAINDCRDIILNSHQNNIGEDVAIRPFKFAENQPSEFNIDFVSDGIEYEYGFSILNGIIHTEYLYHYPNKRKAKVFERSADGKYTYGKGLTQRPKEIEINTAPNTLFLSRGSSMNRPLLRKVYCYFLNDIVTGLGPMDFTTLTPVRFENAREILINAFKVSDTDITDIQLKEATPGQYRLTSYHRENPALPFDFSLEESDGTKRLFWILLTLIEKIATGATIFLDEFDLRLHTFLAEFLLDVVRSSRKAQLVFTSHNPLLINRDTFRREQIIFVTKNQCGMSEFIPLSDYEGLPPELDIRKAYLQGRFDGIPYPGRGSDAIPMFASDL